MENLRSDLLFLDVMMLSGQGMFKETTDFGPCGLKRLLLVSPNVALEAPQSGFGEKSQVGNLLKDGECSFTKIRKPLLMIICKHEPSKYFSSAF